MIPPLGPNEIYGPRYQQKIGEAVNHYNAVHRGSQQPGGDRYGQSPGIIWVKNSSGADRNRFDVLALGAPATTVADGESIFLSERPVFAGNLPSVDAADETAAVLLEDAPSGEIVKAVTIGATIARVDVVDVGHHFAALDDGETIFKSGDSGQARIIWKATASTGEQWAIVHLPAEPAPTATAAKPTGWMASIYQEPLGLGSGVNYESTYTVLPWEWTNRIELEESGWAIGGCQVPGLWRISAQADIRPGKAHRTTMRIRKTVGAVLTVLRTAVQQHTDPASVGGGEDQNTPLQHMYSTVWVDLAAGNNIQLQVFLNGTWAGISTAPQIRNAWLEATLLKPS